MQGTMSGARRKTTHNLNGQHQDVDRTHHESIKMAEDRDKWRKYVHGAANHRIEDVKEQTERVKAFLCRFTSTVLSPV